MSLDKWRGAWCGRNAYSAKSTAAPRHLHRASPLRYAAKPFLRRIYPSRDAALWFATPARQTCHAGMANSKAPSAHSKVPWRNGFAPYRNECKWLRNSGGMCRISPRPPAARFSSPFSTSKSGEKRRCEVWDNRLRALEACADGLAYTTPGHGGEGARRLAAACKAAIGKRMRGR